jgi:hypothetical protein
VVTPTGRLLAGNPIVVVVAQQLRRRRLRPRKRPPRPRATQLRSWSTDRVARKMISSYVGENKEFERQYLGRASSRSSSSRKAAPGHPRRAHPRGRPAQGHPVGENKEFFTPRWSSRRTPSPASQASSRTGYGTRSATAASPTARRPRVRRQALRARARHHDRLRHREGVEGRPLRQPRLPPHREELQPADAAMAGRITIAEVEEIVPVGSLDPTRSTRPACTCTA